MTQLESIQYDSEMEDIRRHRLGIERWETDPWPPITVEERELVHDRIDQLTDARLARADAHRERLKSRASYLGREVAGHRALLRDAKRLLEGMALAMDPETSTPILLVPHEEAIEIIESAFSAGARVEIELVA